MAPPKSDAQLNAEALAKRERPVFETHMQSRAEKRRSATARPESFGALLGWFRREWEAEIPTRMHERGIEPDSQLGAPKLAGAVRHRFAVIDGEANAKATDYDSAHDTWSTGSAPRFPMLDAIARLRDRSPIFADFVTAIGYGGFDWRRVAVNSLRIWDGPAGRFVPDGELDYVVTNAVLGQLWEIWSRGQANAGREA